MNRYEAVVESCDRRDTHAWLRVGRGRLAARMWPGIRAGARLRVRVRPEDVILCASHPGRTSARNVLSGRVRSVRYVLEGAAVELDVGFPLTARVTRGAARELGVRRGVSLYALIKAQAVIPDVEIRPRILVSLVGGKGVLAPDRVAFLEAIGRMRSIAGAARERGITYRTAWLWVREANRVWGTPLVARVHGGRGGGGTALTPEGEGAVAYVRRLEELHPGPRYTSL